MGNYSSNGRNPITGQVSGKQERRSGKSRRRGPRFLVYCLAGGTEKRNPGERRGIEESTQEKESCSEKRCRTDRRKVVKTKYLNCGKVMDQRAATRRSTDRTDPSAVKREKYNRLGPGWID